MLSGGLLVTKWNGLSAILIGCFKPSITDFTWKSYHHHLSGLLPTFSQLIPDITTEIYTKSLLRFFASMAQHHLLQNEDSCLHFPHTCSTTYDDNLEEKKKITIEIEQFLFCSNKQTIIKPQNIHKDETIFLLKHAFLDNTNCRWV